MLIRAIQYKGDGDDNDAFYHAHLGEFLRAYQVGVGDVELFANMK